MRFMRLIDQRGPLPLQSVFVPDFPGPMVLAVTGAMWTESGNYLLQMNVTLDGTLIGSTQIWSNGSNQVRVLPDLFIGLPPLSPGTHTITLLPQVEQDWTDAGFFSATLMF